jgi:hypothetical protein
LPLLVILRIVIHRDAEFAEAGIFLKEKNLSSASSAVMRKN